MSNHDLPPYTPLEARPGPLTIGTAVAQPGKITTGWLQGPDLPTGGQDRFPVILAQGKDAQGPVFWVTAGIHGGEHTGLIVAQRLATPQFVAKLHGTLVIIPTLNPAGLRTRERSPYYYNGDPNRLFPEPPGWEVPHSDSEHPSSLERAYRYVYQTLAESNAVGLLDLHNAQIGSLPLTFRDPVFYQRRLGRGLSAIQAEAAQEQLEAMLDAFGFTVINEFAAEDYISKALHRSVSGSVLNGLGIPAATVELGSWMYVDENVVEAALAGLRNALRWAGMLPGAYEPVEGIRKLPTDQPLRRNLHPRAPCAGIVHHLARAGQRVEVGQPLARMVDIHGQPLTDDDGLLRSAYNGYVLAWYPGVVRYAGDPVMVLGIPDDSEMVLPYPY